MKERKCIICGWKVCDNCGWEACDNVCCLCKRTMTLLKTNGERVRLMPKERYLSLEEIQEAVGGCIELVFKPGLANLGLIAFANEEGLILDLPYNNLAKEVLNRELVGDVLIVPKYLMEPEDNDDKKIVLLQEALHSILEQLGFDEKHDDEHLIQSLATAIFQVFKANQDLLGGK